MIVVLLYVVPCYCYTTGYSNLLLYSCILTVTYSYTLVYSQHTPATNTLVATVVTVDIAYYTTAYTPILLYS